FEVMDAVVGGERGQQAVALLGPRVELRADVGDRAARFLCRGIAEHGGKPGVQLDELAGKGALVHHRKSGAPPAGGKGGMIGKPGRGVNFSRCTAPETAALVPASPRLRAIS